MYVYLIIIYNVYKYNYAFIHDYYDFIHSLRVFNPLSPKIVFFVDILSFATSWAVSSNLCYFKIFLKNYYLRYINISKKLLLTRKGS